MAIVINGSGTVTGISVGGLPDGIVDAGTLATNSVDSAELIDGAVDNSHIDAMAASKLTGALPAISGASLTGVGSVLQIINDKETTNTSVSAPGNTDYNDCATVVAITPSATSSKILIMCTASAFITNTSGDCGAGFRFKQAISGGATSYPTELDMNGTGYSCFYQYDVSSGTIDENVANGTIFGLVSPSTTSEITYTLQICGHSVNSIVNNSMGDTHTIIMEIAG